MEYGSCVKTGKHAVRQMLCTQNTKDTQTDRAYRILRSGSSSAWSVSSSVIDVLATGKQKSVHSSGSLNTYKRAGVFQKDLHILMVIIWDSGYCKFVLYQMTR